MVKQLDDDDVIYSDDVTKNLLVGAWELSSMFTRDNNCHINHLFIHGFVDFDIILYNLMQ